MLGLLAQPLHAGILVGSGNVNQQSGEQLRLSFYARAGYYGAAAHVDYLNPAGVVIDGESFGVSDGRNEITLSLPCGVDQNSMNVASYKIYNDTPGFGLSVEEGNIARSRDAEIARDADGGGGSASDAIELGGGRTIFGALAAVAPGNSEDGKYWNIHLEKGETLVLSGKGVSGNSSSGAALVVEVQDQNNGAWNAIAQQSFYGKGDIGGGFAATAAGNYALRARCTVTRMCKFMIQMNVSGRRLSPCYDGDCSLPMDQTTDNLPVNVANGREQSEFGSDLSVANPVGPDVSFGRRWLEVLALQRAGSPGLARGWMHSYDVRVVGDNSYNVQIQFASGGLETWTATLGANGAPTGELKPPSGAPYRVQGVTNPLQTNAGQKDPNAADYLVDKKWSALELTWDDGSKWSFKPGNARYSYQLDRQFNATGQYLQFAYGTGNGELQTITNQNGTALLTLAYDGDFLANVTDVYGRRVAYTWAQPAGLPKVVLTSVSTIYAANSTGAPPIYQQYEYWPYAAEANKPLLKTIVTRSPNGGSGVMTAYNTYDNAARVSYTTDGNGNVHQYSYLNGSTFIAVKNAGGQTVQVWTQFFDAQGRDTGHADASLNRWTISYDDGNNPLKPTSMVDPMGRVSSTTYDIYGHVTGTVSPRGVRQIMTWDYSSWSLGRLVKTQTQGSNGALRAATTYAYNEPSGLLKTVTYPHPFEGGGTLTSSLTYDAYGNPLTFVEPGENVATRTTTFGYTQDGSYSRPMFVGRPLSVTDTLSHTTHLRYDARGNLTSQIDAAGIVTDTEYDLADQTTRVLLPPTAQTGGGRGQIVNSYSYTGGPLRLSNTLDESGATVRTYNYTYGNEGELKTQYGSNLSQTVEYDALYRMIRFRDGNNNPTNYIYDDKGRLTATAYPNANSNGYDMERTTAFDNSGLPLQMIDGRGVVSNLNYEADGSSSGVSYPASPAENVTLARDAFGQVTQRSDASGTEALYRLQLRRQPLPPDHAIQSVQRRFDESACADHASSIAAARSGAAVERTVGNVQL